MSHFHFKHNFNKSHWKICFGQYHTHAPHLYFNNLPIWNFTHHPPPLQRLRLVHRRRFPTLGIWQYPVTRTSPQEILKWKINVYTAHPSMRSTEQNNIYPDSKNTLLGQLFLIRNTPDSYKAFFSNCKPSTKHVVTTPLSLSLQKPSLNEPIQDSLWTTHLFWETITRSWVLPFLIRWASFRNCWRHFQILTWTIRKEISSTKSINFNELTKRRANIYFTPQYENCRKNYLRPI